MKTTERRMEMKRFTALLVAALLCLSFASCDLEGIGNDGGREEARDNVTPATTENVGVGNDETYVDICVDWMDFIKVNGITYDGGFESKEIDASRVGEKLGEILYTVKSNYSSHEEMNAASNRDFTAAFRPIGSEVFSVKDDKDSIAVLDNGKYYIYTHKESYTIPFVAFGGERNSLPRTDEINRGITVNSFDQLCEAWGGAENIPTEILNHYSDDTFFNFSLVIVELISGWGGTEFGIRSVSKSGDDLLVNAVQLDSDEEGDCAMHYWTFFIEIPKTDDKKVIVEVDKYDPLAYDQGLKKVTYEEISEFHIWTPGEDYGYYEGQAVLNKYAVEEMLCGMYNYTLKDIEISYNPTYNYWLAKHYRKKSDGGNTAVYTVIRAADGRLISSIEQAE